MHMYVTSCLLYVSCMLTAPSVYYWGTPTILLLCVVCLCVCDVCMHVCVYAYWAVHIQRVGFAFCYWGLPSCVWGDIVLLCIVQYSKRLPLLWRQIPSRNLLVAGVIQLASTLTASTGSGSKGIPSSPGKKYWGGSCWLGSWVDGWTCWYSGCALIMWGCTGAVC